MANVGLLNICSVVVPSSHLEEIVTTRAVDAVFHAISQVLRALEVRAEGLDS